VLHTKLIRFLAVNLHVECLYGQLLAV